ncbi:PD40 domain-containing protein [Fulvivirgaceae bacterium PWU5]|uniref:PD40 domain-containing protein n=1 Tax=Dawidia cretensis TaxID=2782350 RepID=A0AAP2DYI1_9BACT|nr:hypothetical protein [Dawidia cretensis]MBT1708377.1 PD40 domain-containing protein [Dawidia cretensis]
MNVVRLLIAVCLLNIFACTTREEKEHDPIPYPFPLPHTTALTFLKGIVSTDSLDFNAAFSPDGKAYYFTRSINGQLILYFTRYDSIWHTAVPVPFTEAGYSQADPAFGPDGKLYFISNRPKDSSDTLADYDIWYVSPQGDGWSPLQNLAVVNSDSNEYYISVAHNSNIYFASSRAGGLGQEDIYVSEYSGGNYGMPQNLGPAINSEMSEYDPGISPREDLLVFASSKRTDTFGGADLYGTTRGDDGVWKPAVHFGPTFNTGTREYCPYFSPDEAYFFFSSQRDVKWVGIEAVRSTLQP